MDFLLIAVLTVLNGLFAMSELALASSRKARLLGMAEAGDVGAQVALKLIDQPTRLLSTVQVGITSIGVLNGIVGEAAFSEPLATWLRSLGIGDRAAGIAATAGVVTAITFTTIIFGELVPKRIGQLYPEAVSRRVSRPMYWMAAVAGPFVRLLTATTQGVLSMLRINQADARAVTEEEIVHSLEEGVDAGVIEHQEHQMVQNVFRLDDRPLSSMMIPRSDIEWLRADLRVQESILLASKLGTRSWYPVCRDSLEDVVGVVSLATLLAPETDPEATLGALVKAAVFVPETLSGMELLEQFRQRSGRMVFVVDEYGVVQGLVTPHDLLEAITGELKPPAQADAWAVIRADGTWLIDGVMPIAELKARLGIRELPDEDRGRYNTVAGLVMAVSGHLPQLRERIECSGWQFEVADLDGRRVDKLIVSKLLDPE